MAVDSSPARSMNVFDPECTSREVLSHATGRWGALILATLIDGPLRFAQVRRAVVGISDRMLAQTLHDLEADGLISRTQHEGIPLRVDYELTELGRPIASRVCDLITTIYEQLPGIVTHRRTKAPTPSG